MLWNDSHEKWQDFLKRCYMSSAGQLKLTQEWQADAVVQVHAAHGGQTKTGVHFNPASASDDLRRKANEAALKRYLTDPELMFELAPYLLGAMSDESKLAFANQYLHPAGMRAVLAESEEEDGFGIEHACDVQIHTARAFESLVEAAKNPTPANLEIADREAHKASERFARTRKMIARIRGGAAKAKAAIVKACKERA